MSDQPENTPAGSYRVAGNDVSHYLGVDDEYKNYSDETQKAMLNEEEAFLYLPAPDDENPAEEEVTPGEEETDSESADLVDEGAEDHEDDDEKVTYDQPVGDHPTGDSTEETPSGDVYNLAPRRPVL